MNRFFPGSFGLLLCVAAAGCTSELGQDASNVTDEGPQGELRLMVTVDWEGRDLADHNLAAMTALRERFPQVPLVHFLNAAYLTKPDVNTEDVRARIDGVLRPDDELGLHIHAWKRLFEAAGVTFRDSPTFWGGTVPSYSCSYDCGHDVPISEYDRAELEQVIQFSLAALDEAGYGRAVSFRAGGWMAAPNVREALVAQGLLIDSSAVPAYFLADEIGDAPLHHWVEVLWEGTDATSQPYELEGLTEIPDNGALADYVTADEMFQVYVDAKQRWAEQPDQDIVVNIGFHQETAEKYLPRVDEALDRMLTDAAEAGVPLRPTVMSAGD